MTIENMSLKISPSTSDTGFESNKAMYSFAFEIIKITNHLRNVNGFELVLFKNTVEV